MRPPTAGLRSPICRPAASSSRSPGRGRARCWKKTAASICTPAFLRRDAAPRPYSRNCRSSSTRPAPRRAIARDLVANLCPLAIQRQLAPQLSYRLDGVARIEAQRALAQQAAAPVAPEFQAKSAAFERVDALEQGHRLEPPQQADRVGDPA